MHTSPPLQQGPLRRADSCSISQVFRRRGETVSFSRYFDAQFFELQGGGVGPAAVGGGRSRARMENSADFRAIAAQGDPGPTFGESAHADDEARSKDGDAVSQRLVAQPVELLTLIGLELVRGEVSPTRFEKLQRAVVADKKSLKELFGSGEGVFSPAPEASTGDFASSAGETEHRSFGMFVGRSPNTSLDPEPVTHCGDFAKRNTGLGHPPGAGVHSEQKYLPRAASVSPEVLRVDFPSVVQRIVDMAHGLSERELRDTRSQPIRDQFEIHGSHHLRY